MPLRVDVGSAVLTINQGSTFMVTQQDWLRCLDTCGGRSLVCQHFWTLRLIYACETKLA